MNVEHPPNPHRFRKKAPSRESSLSLSVALCGSQEEEAALKTNTPSNHIQSHPITRHQAPKGPNSTQREGERETATRETHHSHCIPAHAHIDHRPLSCASSKCSRTPTLIGSRSRWIQADGKATRERRSVVAAKREHGATMSRRSFEYLNGCRHEHDRKP